MPKEKFQTVRCPVMVRDHLQKTGKSLDLEVTLLIDESEPTKVKGVICPEYKTDHCKIRYEHAYNPCIFQKPHRF